ncbi:MAG: hypothetical protein E7K04_05170, partial [Helicobacter sp.]|nr:hypothetical protein [Helicobacter sp.]
MFNINGIFFAKICEILDFSLRYLLGLVCITGVYATPSIVTVGKTTTIKMTQNDKNILGDKENQLINSTTTEQNIDISATGAYSGSATTSYGWVLGLTDSKTKIYSNRNQINFQLDFSGVTGTNGSIFSVSKGSSKATFESSLTVQFAKNSNIGQGVFLSTIQNSNDPNGNDQTGSFVFKKNLYIDTSGTTNGNGGTSYIFNLDQKKGKIFVNYADTQRTAENPLGSIVSEGNIVKLIGDVKQTGADSELNINLTNNTSYFLGKQDYLGGHLNLGLKNGGKWIVTGGNPKINNLDIQNANEITDGNANLQSLSTEGNISSIDLVRARVGENGLTNATGNWRQVEINKLFGNHGLFRLLVDYSAGQKGEADHIKIQNKNTGAQSHHLQLLQDPARRDPTKNVEIEVAEIINGGD